MPLTIRDVEINGFNKVVEEPFVFPEAGQYEVTVIAPTADDYEDDGSGNKMIYGMSASLSSGGTFVDADGQDATPLRDYPVDERSVVGTFILTANAGENFVLDIAGNISADGIVAYITKKMSPMVLRADKGSVLTHDEMDNNFKIANEVEEQKKLAVDLYVSNVSITERLSQLETNVPAVNNAIEPYYSSTPYYMGVDPDGNIGWGRFEGYETSQSFVVVKGVGEVVDASDLPYGGVIISSVSEWGMGFLVKAVSVDQNGDISLSLSSVSLPSGFTALLNDIPRFGYSMRNQILATIRDESFGSAVGKQFGWSFYKVNWRLEIIFGGASEVCPASGYTLVTIDKTLSDDSTVQVNRWCRPVAEEDDLGFTINYVEYR